MSLTKSIYDDLSRDLSPVEREYGEWVDDDRPDEDDWPSDQEYSDDLDHE